MSPPCRPCSDRKEWQSHVAFAKDARANARTLNIMAPLCRPFTKHSERQTQSPFKDFCKKCLKISR